MKKGSFLLMMVLSIFLMVSCMTNHHVIGLGAEGNKHIQHTQIYLFWSLIPINFWETSNGYVDTVKMAGTETEHYEIKTYTSFTDGLVYFFTSGILGTRTVVVIK